MVMELLDSWLYRRKKNEVGHCIKSSENSTRLTPCTSWLYVDKLLSNRTGDLNHVICILYRCITYSNDTIIKNALKGK